MATSGFVEKRQSTILTESKNQKIPFQRIYFEEEPVGWDGTRHDTRSD